MMRSVCAVALLLMTVGCSQQRTDTFDLTVTNQTQHPVTLWLCKDGPPYEDAWLSPEEVVQTSPKMTTPIGGVQLDAGRTAHANIKGQFDTDTHAFLRIYNATGFNNILAISRGSPNRIDMPIDPTPTHITVDDKPGHIEAIVH